MPVREEQSNLAYFHLDLDRQTPANPDLINGILQELGENIKTIPLIADEFQRRVADGSLLAGIHPNDRKLDGVAIEAVSRSLGDKEADVWSVLQTLTHPRTGLKGEIYTIFSFLEGRDDKQSKHFGGVLLLNQIFDFLNVATHKRLSAIAVWDVHSRESLNRLVKVNGSSNKPEIISLTAMPLFADKLSEDGLLENDNLFVAAPDFGGFTKAWQMARSLRKKLIFIDKERPEPNNVVVKGVYLINEDGTVEKKDKTFLKDKTVIFIDDMLDTGGTAIDDSVAVKNAGATKVIFVGTHAVFSDPPKDRESEKPRKTLKEALEDDTIDYIYVSDSLPQNKKINHPRARHISLAKPIAALIRIAADRASGDDYNLVRRCLYNPGPSKNVIEKYFKKGNIAPAYKGFNMQDAVYGDRSRTVFSRQPSPVN